MPDLTILRAKPNPLGKDKFGQFSPNTQLNGEWLDIQNTSGKNLAMAGVTVFHYTFNAFCSQLGEKVLYVFPQWTLPAGAVVRIHAGEKPTAPLPPQDENGANYHAYTNSPYTLNNVCGDTVMVKNDVGREIDRSWYASRPLEGKILLRVNSMLV